MNGQILYTKILPMCHFFVQGTWAFGIEFVSLSVPRLGRLANAKTDSGRYWM